MKKLSFYLLFLLFLGSCSSIKHVPKKEQLLTKNTIYVDSVKTSNDKIAELLLQRPNSRALGLPLPLYFYNLGNPNGSKDVAEWKKNHPRWYNMFKSVFSEKQSIGVAKTFIRLNDWFLNNGEAPVLIDKTKIKKIEKNLQVYYFTEGYFRAKVWSKRDTVAVKKGKLSYYILKGKPSFLDSITKNITSPVIDSLYITHQKKSFLKSGEQYKDRNFINEANRLIKLFRNNGVYHFAENNIEFDVDTLNYQKPNVNIKISDRLVEKNGNYISKPFKIQTIKKINVFTDYSYELRNTTLNDTIKYNNITYFAHKKLRYNPKYLSQSLFIKPNQVYTDSLRVLTRTHLRRLKNFKTTSIRYRELNDNELEANIYLTPIEKYTLGGETELSRSNIRNFDVSAQFSILNRNTFKGAEIFKLAILGSYFNSNNGPGWEIGTNLSLEVPRFIAPFGINKSVPKRMFPVTRFSTGMNIQKNIALDKQNISVGIDYRWRFNKRKSIQLEVLNGQYIRNLNTENYFNIYRSEFNKLVDIARAYNYTDNLESYNEIRRFMRTVALNGNFASTNSKAHQQNSNVLNRHNIITSDFLIPVIAYNFTYNSKDNLNDNTFSYFRIRIANSGNVLGFLTNEKNSLGKETLFNIPIAQYFKTDFEFKKFWDVGYNSVLAHRTFLGAIIPYNKSNIPFSKSYFAGGSNDIRAWKTYDLGPGRRSRGLEYNIGSFKFLTSLEYRFDLVGSLKSAIFIDAGNIWDISNSAFVEDDAKLNNFKSITDIAVGAGFGMRYDLKFLVVRLDLGFKAREPYLKNKRWFQNFNFGNVEYNIGINYPF